MDGTADEERLLSAAIRDRLRRFEHDHDAASLLDADTDTECARLLSGSPGSESLELVASLQRVKSLVALDELAGGTWRPDRSIGYELHRRDPALLHPRMRDLLALDPSAVPGSDLAHDTERGYELLESAQSDGDEETLRQAVLLFRAIVAATAEGDPALAPRLSNLGAALATRFDFSGALGDLFEALIHCREAVRLADEADPELSRHLSNLANVLANRYELMGDQRDLDDAVGLARAAVESIKPADHRAAGYLSNLGVVLEMTYTRDGDRAILDEAVDTARRAVRAAAETYGPADRAGYLANLGNVLMLRYRRDGRRDDLDAAVDGALAAIELVPAGHPDRHLHLTNAANVLAARFEAYGDTRDLDEAIAAGQGAAAATGPGHSLRGRYLSNLGSLLLVRFRRDGEPSDLDAAVAASAEAAGASVGGQDERAAYLTNLGNASLTRFEHRGSRTDLTVGVTSHQEATDLTPDDHPHRIRRLVNLCEAARLAFTVGGRAEDLDLAIRSGREAVGKLPSGHPDRLVARTNLASALHVRFARLNAVSDLDQVIELSRTAAEESPAGHPWRSHRLANLAAALRSRFGRSGDPDDLRQALEAVRAAVRTDVDDPVHRGALWAALGNTLLTDTARRTDEELAEAVAAHRHAVAATPSWHVGRRERLANLSAAHAACFARTGDRHDLDEAIRTIRRAVSPAGAKTDPDHAMHLSNLGVLLRARYELTGADADRRAALRSWRRAASNAVGSTGARIAAAYSWGEFARGNGDTEDALQGYATAVQLQARLAWRGMDRLTREDNLGPWSGLACDAAACALEDGRPERAVELLEEGRSVLWAQALRTRGDLSPLRERRPEYADRLSEIRRLLDHYEAVANQQASGVVPPERPSGAETAEALIRDERIRLAQEWDDILARVRRLKGFAGFLTPRPFAELVHAADDGHVVMVNVSRYRCDALVLADAGVRVVALPELTMAGLARAVAEYTNMVSMIRGYRNLSADGRHRLDEGMRDILRWLWRVVAEPVMAELGLEHRDGDRPRLWWCPTGLLGLLPLHAAQEYDPASLRDSGVPDRVVSSFTSTLGRLLAARAAEPQSTEARRALVVGLGETPGLPSLPDVDDELAALAPRLGMPVTWLRDSAATWEDVTERLPGHSWLHFAGHSGQDLSRPGKAALFLYDRRLTALQISDLQLRNAAFAFLSSCESGLGDAVLPDEALQLATALQVAGYRQIVATLWPIRDATATSVVAEFYARLAGSPGAEPARALDDALRRLRSTHQALVWAGYCHIGI